MILIPAIDIRDGHAVRLVQGDFDRETVYAGDPLDAARDWLEAGADELHVVDLDGAKEGGPRNLEHVARITDAASVPVQLGGGIRTLADAEAGLAAGAARVVLGTAAHRDPDLLDALVERDPARVAVAVDVRGGKVSVSGWLEATELTATDLVERMQARGVERYVYTQVDRDGMLDGPDLGDVVEFAAALAPGSSFIYSGGVGSLEHLAALAELGLPALQGVISGKALYEKCFSVAEGQAALRGDG